MQFFHEMTKKKSLRYIKKKVKINDYNPLKSDQITRVFFAHANVSLFVF